MTRFALSNLLLIAFLFALHCRADDLLPRTWTNSLGVKMEATFLREEDGKVTLLLNNGQMITMPADKLSQADQDYIHDLQVKTAAPPAPAMEPAATPPANPPQTESPQAPTPPRGKSMLLRPQSYHEPDPRVQPQAEIYVPFPELGKSRTDEPMGMRIRIPKNYRPDQPVPLLVWLAGGDGNSRFNAAETLVDEEQFVLVGMNYPSALPETLYATKLG